MYKAKVVLQFGGRDVDVDEIEKQAKVYWKQDGHKLGQIKTLDIYLKPEESAAYYSINEDEQKGRVQF